MSTPQSRPEQIKNCEWCRLPMPEIARSDKKYCSGVCRREAYLDRAHKGKIASVRRLKSGKMSVIVHMDHDTGLVPGMSAMLAEEK